MDDVVYENDATRDVPQNAQDDPSFGYAASLHNFSESEVVSGQPDQWLPSIALSDNSFPHINFDTSAALSAVDQEPLISANDAFDPSDLGQPFVATSASMPPPAIPTVTTQPRKRISNELWTAQKENIRALFITQGLTLSETMKIMEESYHFSASENKYKGKLKEWGFNKNLTQRQAKFIRRMVLQRRKVGKKSKFRVNGKQVPLEKMERHCRMISEGESSLAGTCPTGVEYDTPHPTQPETPHSEYVMNLSPDGSKVRSQKPQIHDAVGALPPQREHSIIGEPLSTIRLTWNGLNMSALTNLHQRAVQLTEESDYAGARVMFLEAIDGLGALMGPAHKSTICALESFVDFCTKQDFFDDAEQKLQESLTKHQDKWGEHDAKTLRSMARLGRLYLLQKRYGESEILLMRSKAGFESIYNSEPERLFINTCAIVQELVDLFRLQLDFLRAEQEFLSLIAKAEALNEPYRIRCLRLKYDLAVLYLDYKWRQAIETPSFVPLIPLLKREQVLLELLEHVKDCSLLTYWELYSLTMLGMHYSSLEDTGKIGPLVDLIEKLIDPEAGAQINDDEYTQEHFLDLRWALFWSNSKLGRQEAARKCFKFLQEHTEKNHGPQSHDAIDLLVKAASVYFWLNLPQEAEPLLQEALLRTETVLQPDDPLIAKTMDLSKKKKPMWKPWWIKGWMVPDSIPAASRYLASQSTDSKDQVTYLPYSRYLAQ